MEHNELWQAVLGDLEIQISRTNFLTWFKQSKILDRRNSEGVVLVGLPNNFAKEWVRNRYHKLILGSLRTIDPSIKNIEYSVAHANTATVALPQNAAAKKEEHHTPKLPLDSKIDLKTNLNPRYTLESLVVGSSNELAYAAIQAIIKEPGKKYNPLFLYGGVGLGKTHLLQAAGNEIKKQFENSIRVFYVTSEKFLNDVIAGIKNKRTEDIKRKYRDVDILIIDDIQFIGGKATTEQEFFHTFNALYENNKQIIISSDKPPGAIPILEERLRSRFEGGMVVDITYPDYEMRLAILKSKMEKEQVFLEDKTLEIIASKVQRNVRELEGVLNKVIFYTSFKKERVDEKKIDDIVNEITQVSHKNITPQEIIKVVADFFEVSISDLINKGRKKEVVEPRQIAMFLLRDMLKLSYPHIGERIGKRDHTTVIHACEKINKELAENQQLNQKILLLRERLYKSG